MSAPAQIGPYPVERKLAEGGFGEVFVAVQPNLRDRRVCIKRIKREILEHEEHGERLLSLFYGEIDLASKLSHPNIVSIIDAGEDRPEGAREGAPGLPYVVMEYVEGVDAAGLLKMTKPRGLDPRHVAYIVVGAAQALAYAHHEAVIHRDVKPQNILVSGNGLVKLADFGIGKMQREGQYQATRTSSFIGTHSYMAPELLTVLSPAAASDAVTFNHKVDLWALGVTAWELLCGFRPFEDATLGTPPGVGSGTWALINVRADPPRRRSIHEVAPDAPQALRDVIEAMLTPGLRERVATADEVVRRLVEAGLGLPTHRAAFVRDLLAKDTVPSMPGARPTPSPKPGPAPSSGASAPTPEAEHGDLSGVRRDETPPHEIPPHATQPLPQGAAARISEEAAPASPALPSSPERPPSSASQPRRALLAAALGVLAVVALGAGAAAFALGGLFSGNDRARERPAAAVAPPEDPSPPAAPAAASDAGASRPDAGSMPSPEVAQPTPEDAGAPARPERPGFISVVVVPLGDVRIDGRPVSVRTPHRVSPGRHRVVATYAGQRRSRVVEVSPGEREQVVIRFN